jgi:SAM-dependent methyltransferase
MLRFLARQFARPSGWAGRYLIAPILDRTGRAMSMSAFRALAPAPAERILEVGFGGGLLIDKLLGSGADVTGVDASDAMVSRAQRRLGRRQGSERARFLVGTAEDIPAPSAAFDKAVSVNVLYFWPDLGRVFSEFARVLRRGGLLVLCFQTPASVRNWPGHRFGFLAYSGEEVERELVRAGFGIVRSTSGSDAGVGDFICVSAERL